jgi:hypothetical protein
LTPERGNGGQLGIARALDFDGSASGGDGNGRVRGGDDEGDDEPVEEFRIMEDGAGLGVELEMERGAGREGGFEARLEIEDEGVEGEGLGFGAADAGKPLEREGGEKGTFAGMADFREVSAIGGGGLVVGLEQEVAVAVDGGEVMEKVPGGGFNLGVEEWGSGGVGGRLLLSGIGGGALCADEEPDGEQEGEGGESGFGDGGSMGGATPGTQDEDDGKEDGDCRQTPVGGAFFGHRFVGGHVFFFSVGRSGGGAKRAKGDPGPVRGGWWFHDQTIVSGN